MWLFKSKPKAPKPLILKDSDMVVMPYLCPHSQCRGKLMALKGEIEMISPNGKVKREDRRQFYCLNCHSHYVGSSAKSVSKMTFTPHEINQWRARLAKEGVTL